ncbi:MAG: hypothetical protein ACP5XB_23960 [Isosphaeraceae bacterium]
MSDFRSKGRPSPSRAFRPALDGRLEDRLVLSPPPSLHQYVGTSLALLKNPTARLAFHVNQPPFALNAPRWIRQYRVIHAPAFQTIRGGEAVNVIATDGSRYRIQLGYVDNTVQTAAADGAGGSYTQTTTSAASIIQPSGYPQPIGTVRCYAMPNGEVGIIVDGSSPNTELTINPLPHPIVTGYAHSYAYGQSGVSHVLNIGQITVNSGQIGDIEGFHTANLVGPLTATGSTTIDRIALNSIQPGGSILTGGTVNTLDIYQGITLNTGTNIQIGRDLNLLNVGGDINLSNGSNFLIGRDLGAVLQPPKGTGSGSNVLSLYLNNFVTTVSTSIPPEVATFIQGGLNIGPGSSFVVGRAIDNAFYIIGNITGASRLVIPKSNVNPLSNTLISLGTITP